MKEGEPNALDLAKDHVIHVEDEWIKHKVENLEKLGRRAEGSKTTIAWNEYYSAKQQIEDELERLTPPEWDMSDEG